MNRITDTLLEMIKNNPKDYYKDYQLIDEKVDAATKVLTR